MVGVDRFPTYDLHAGEDALETLVQVLIEGIAKVRQGATSSAIRHITRLT